MINDATRYCAAMARSFALPRFSLRWKPTDCRVSEDGSMAFTYGQYERRYQNSEGEIITATGRYTTIWSMQSDGEWKIILDIGN